MLYEVITVKKDPELTVDQVKAHARENLTGYKQPKYIEFRTVITSYSIHYTKLYDDDGTVRRTGLPGLDQRRHRRNEPALRGPGL